LVIFIFVSSQTGFSVHSRYIIPALPFFFIWISKVGRVFEPSQHFEEAKANSDTSGLHSQPLSHNRVRGVVSWLRGRRQPVMAIFVVLALIWSVGSSLSIYPHSLSYFNELAAILPTPADESYPTPIKTHEENQGLLSRIVSVITAGPRNAPRHLLDSNIDWGQDLFYLKDWLDTHSDVTLAGLAVWGSYPATLTGIPQTPMPLPGPIEKQPVSAVTNNRVANQTADDLGPKPGWYALSVNYIYDRDRQYRYFLNFEPVAMAGYSIYIYHITLDDANRVRRELGLPEVKDENERQESKKTVFGRERDNCLQDRCLSAK
jgi:hypothetical protein